MNLFMTITPNGPLTQSVLPTCSSKDEGSAQLVPTMAFPPPAITLDPSNPPPITFEASSSDTSAPYPSITSFWILLSSAHENLAIEELKEYAARIENEQPLFSEECYRILRNEPATEFTLRTAFVVYITAQKQENYNLANYIYSKFGERIIPAISDHYTFLKEDHLGTDEESFRRLIRNEIAYVRNVLRESKGVKSPYLFDKGFLRRISEEFLRFWEGQQPPYLEFEDRLDKFPFRGRINYFEYQLKIWDVMQKDERMKDFPIEEIWRFGIDFFYEEKGPCSLEHEPGYLRAYLRGIYFALATEHDPKSSGWYDTLHYNITLGTFLPISDADHNHQRHYASWDGDYSSFSTHDSILRTRPVKWGIDVLDSDPIGMKDIKSNRYWSFDGKNILSYLPDGSTIETRKNKLDSLMNHYQNESSKAPTSALKLMNLLAWARDLELLHFYKDGNGRGSHSAFLGFIKEDKRLPMCLFPDPNVFDCNGPESLAYRYLEACLNFRNGGRGHRYKKTKSRVKSLEKLDLNGHADLVALKEALKPLVVDKEWSEVVHLFEERTKRTLQPIHQRSSSKRSRRV